MHKGRHPSDSAQNERSLLEIENVVLKNNDSVLLDNINLTMGNEKLLLLGVSGSGKSLLLDVIAGNLRHEGKVRFGLGLTKGERTFSYDIFAMLSLMKVEEVLNMWSAIYRKPRNAEMISQLRINEINTKQIRVLSKGERKRLSVYAALFSNPKLAILDEPTDGMDPILRDVFWDLVAQRRGGTLVTTHLWEEAAEHHDRVAFISKGKLLAQPQSMKDLLRSMRIAGKIVVGEAVPSNESDTGYLVDQRRSLFFANESQKSEIIARAERHDRSAGYSVLPVSIRDLYVLFGGQLGEVKA